MIRHPRVGRYLDDEEQALIESLEDRSLSLTGGVTPTRRKAIEDMARATMADERARVLLRVPKRDLIRLKSRALQEGVSYQTLINALIHKYVS